MPRPKRNFAPMPLAVLASNAPPRAKLLILALYHHDWDGQKAWPSQERLARIMSVNRHTVTEAIRDCEKLGWIKVQKRFAKTAVYSLDIPDMGLSEFESSISGVPLAEKLPKVQAPLWQKNDHPLAENMPLTKNKERSTLYTNVYKAVSANSSTVPPLSSPTSQPDPKAIKGKPAYKIGAFIGAFRASLPSSRRQYFVTGRDSAALKRLLDANRLSLEVWSDACQVFFQHADKWTDNHALYKLADNFNRYQVENKTCQHEWGPSWETRDGAQFKKCGKCEAIVELTAREDK